MTEHPALPARWIDGLYVISPGTGLGCPRRSARLSHASLTSAPGGQDHTISPSASMLFVGTRLRAATRYGHRIPASRIVTIARTPLSDEAGCM